MELMDEHDTRGAHAVTVCPPLKPAPPRVLLADAAATLTSARKGINRTPPDVMSIRLGAALRLIAMADKQLEAMKCP